MDTVTSIIFGYRFFDGDKYNKTIQRCLSRRQGVFFCQVWFFKVSGQSIMIHELRRPQPIGRRSAAGNSAWRLRTIRPLIRSVSSGQITMLLRSDDHSPAHAARRAETQPDGFRQSARFFEHHTLGLAWSDCLNVGAWCSGLVLLDVVCRLFASCKKSGYPLCEG